MQKLIYTFILLVSTTGFSQITSGSIEYEVTTQYTGKPMDFDPYSGDDLYRFKDNKSYFTMDFDANYLRFYASDRTSADEYSLFNKKDEVILILMPGEFGGTAEYYSTHVEPEQEDYYGDKEMYPDLEPETPDTMIVGLPDSKEILGYTCKRTVLQVSDGTIITIWSTDAIVNTQGLVKLGKSISGTALEVTISDKTRYLTQKATRFSSQKPETPFTMVPPKSFQVSAPTLYITKDSAYYSDKTFPSFITYPNYKKGWDTMRKELEKLPSVELQDDINEYEYSRSFMRVFIELSATGEITSFHAESDMNNEVQQTEVTKLLNKKGSFTPMKVEGLVVASEIQLIF